MTQTVQKRHRQASCGCLPDDRAVVAAGHWAVSKRDALPQGSIDPRHRNLLPSRLSRRYRRHRHHLIIPLIIVVVVIIAVSLGTVRSRSKQIIPELVAPCSPRVSFHFSATARRGETIDYPVSTLLFRQRVKARRVTRSGGF
ncbi:hypothetical protein GQX73_g5717 [Xylaria multiplex]|uniref:Uncharacterized protein n=1 Tax=Xylaria multiplex TaxID=323545 RepID=A0A7C8MLB5_9PEZI|nr:hypothetical protein GQX73_g5717 [Xylaria multiplex]